MFECLIAAKELDLVRYLGLLEKIKNANNFWAARICGWHQRFNRLDSNIIYRKENLIGAADSLSRISVDADAYLDEIHGIFVVGKLEKYFNKIMQIHGGETITGKIIYQTPFKGGQLSTRGVL